MNGKDTKWHDVQLDPPEKEGSYIVATDRGGVFVSHWYPERTVNGIRTGGGFTGARGHITHWMPRPEPPGEPEPKKTGTDEVDRKFWLCDPEKNAKCRKSRCGAIWLEELMWLESPPKKGFPAAMAGNGFLVISDDIKNNTCFLTCEPKYAQETPDGRRVRVRVYRQKMYAGWVYRIEYEGPKTGKDRTRDK